jgi:polysaccharide export outer membrane protein
VITRGLILASILVLACCAQQQAAHPGQMLAQVTPDLLPVVNEPDDVALPDFVSDVGVAPVVLGPGDLIAVSVVEPAGGGLFTPLGAASTGKITRLPPLTLDASGAVVLPFAGRVEISGLSPADASIKLQQSLSRLAIRPQVQVVLQTSVTRQVTVTGAVRHPGSQQIPTSGLLLLDAITAAGGASANTYDTTVELDRAGTQNRIRLDDLAGQPIFNVNLRQGDRLALTVEPHRISLLGAVAGGNQDLPAQGESLAQAVARAPRATQAYLLRQEPRDTALRLAAVIARQQRAAGTDSLGNALAGQEPFPPAITARNDGRPIPVMFSFNPSDPSQLMLAAQIGLRDGDAVFVPAANKSAASVFAWLR